MSLKGEQKNTDRCANCKLTMFCLAGTTMAVMFWDAGSVEALTKEQQSYTVPNMSDHVYFVPYLILSKQAHK